MKHDDKYFKARGEHERLLAAKSLTRWGADMHGRSAALFEGRAIAFRVKHSLPPPARTGLI